MREIGVVFLVILAGLSLAEIPKRSSERAETVRVARMRRVSREAVRRLENSRKRKSQQSLIGSL